MALTDANKSALAFKNTQGKSHTATNKELANEIEPFHFVVGSDKIWTTPILSTPDPAVVESITVSLELDPTSNGRAFLAYYPEGHPSASQRIRNLVPNSFGDAYEAVVTDTNGDRIAPFDARDWVFQYQPGIFFQQTANATPIPASASVYVYKGETLSSSLASNILGNSNAPIVSNSPAAFNGPTFSAGETLWINEPITSYTANAESATEVNVLVRYGMTCSNPGGNHATIFSLSVPTASTMVDADITILAKDNSLMEHSRYRLSTYVFNNGSEDLYSGNVVETIPAINTVPEWNYNIEVTGSNLLVHITGSADYFIDWTMHGRFIIG